MYRIAFIFMIFTLFGSTISGQHTLKIEIKNLKNNSGNITMNLSDGDDNELKAIFEEIVNNKCIIIINDLKPGKYSFKYFHDENKNKKLDTYWIGAPKEGYGFSNNAKGNFGPPDFEETVFEIKSDTTLTCTINYINI